MLWDSAPIAHSLVQTQTARIRVCSSWQRNMDKVVTGIRAGSSLQIVGHMHSPLTSPCPASPESKSSKLYDGMVPDDLTPSPTLDHWTSASFESFLYSLSSCTGLSPTVSFSSTLSIPECHHGNTTAFTLVTAFLDHIGMRSLLVLRFHHHFSLATSQLRVSPC